MKLTERPSGLVVPQPKPRRITHPPPEIQDDEKRERAKEAMSQLWDALDLSDCGGICALGFRPTDMHRRLCRIFGQAILGDDCPEKEVLC